MPKPQFIASREEAQQQNRVLLKDMFQSMLEVMMGGERTSFLVEDRSEGRTNYANGYYERALETALGKLDALDIPRDREGRFHPRIIERYKRRMLGQDQLIVSLYAHGVSDRDIESILKEVYGESLSPQAISRINSGVREERKAWQNRSLSPCWVALYIDAIVVKVRRQTVENEAVYLLIGVTEQGNREILGMHAGGAESASVWAEYLQDLKRRGVKEVLIGVMDGLTGLEEAFRTVFPKADVQRCYVHQVRSTLLKVRQRDKHALAAQLRDIRQAKTYEEGMSLLETFTERWQKLYPSVAESWHVNRDSLLTFLKYPDSLRRYIYTTNWIERLNKELRKVVKTKNSFPTEDAVLNLLYLKIIHVNEKFESRKVIGFSEAREWIEQTFTSRYPQKTFTQDC